MHDYICIYNKQEHDAGVYLIANQQILPAPSFPQAASLELFIATVNAQGISHQEEILEGKNVRVTIKNVPPTDPHAVAFYFQQHNYDAMVLTAEQARVWAGIHHYDLPDMIKRSLLQNIRKFSSEVIAAITSVFESSATELKTLTEQEKSLREKAALIEGSMMATTEKIIQKYAQASG